LNRLLLYGVHSFLLPLFVRVLWSILLFTPIPLPLHSSPQSPQRKIRYDEVPGFCTGEGWIKAMPILTPSPEPWFGFVEVLSLRPGTPEILRGLERSGREKNIPLRTYTCTDSALPAASAFKSPFIYPWNILVHLIIFSKYHMPGKRNIYQ
jgi:hypothetical protein